MTTVMRTAEQEKLRDSLRLDDLKIVTPKVLHKILIETIHTEIMTD